MVLDVLGTVSPSGEKQPSSDLPASAHPIILVPPVLQFFQAALQIAASAQSRTNLELRDVTLLSRGLFLILLVH